MKKREKIRVAISPSKNQEWVYQNRFDIYASVRERKLKRSSDTLTVFHIKTRNNPYRIPFRCWGSTGTRGITIQLLFSEFADIHDLQKHDILFFFVTNRPFFKFTRLSVTLYFVRSECETVGIYKKHKNPSHPADDNSTIRPLHNSSLLLSQKFAKPSSYYYYYYYYYYYHCDINNYKDIKFDERSFWNP